MEPPSEEMFQPDEITYTSRLCRKLDRYLFSNDEDEPYLVKLLDQSDILSI